jgi:hypothetical protein
VDAGAGDAVDAVLLADATPGVTGVADQHVLQATGVCEGRPALVEDLGVVTSIWW